jgi:hypothetical protein
MDGMTDPTAIPMVKELIEFAYSRRASTQSRLVAGRTFESVSNEKDFCAVRGKARRRR